MNNMAAYYLHRFLEADKRNKELEHENKMLKNRCSALSEGTMCMFCPYECENRSKDFRGHIND